MVPVCPNHHHGATIKNPKAAQASAETDPLAATLQRTGHLGSVASHHGGIQTHGHTSIQTRVSLCPHTVVKLPCTDAQGLGATPGLPLTPSGDRLNPQSLATNPTTHLSTRDTAGLRLLNTWLS